MGIALTTDAIACRVVVAVIFWEDGTVAAVSGLAALAKDRNDERKAEEESRNV